MKTYKEKLEKLTKKQMTKIVGGAGGGVGRDKGKSAKQGRG